MSELIHDGVSEKADRFLLELADSVAIAINPAEDPNNALLGPERATSIRLAKMRSRLRDFEPLRHFLTPRRLLPWVEAHLHLVDSLRSRCGVQSYDKEAGSLELTSLARDLALRVCPPEVYNAMIDPLVDPWDETRGTYGDANHNLRLLRDWALAATSNVPDKGTATDDEWLAKAREYANLIPGQGRNAPDNGAATDDGDPSEGTPEGPKKTRKRRKRLSQEATPLTAKQLEAMQIVGECKGDFAEAARRLGKDRKTVVDHYEAATKKAGKRQMKHMTQQIAKDRRGQDNLADGDDRRGI